MKNLVNQVKSLYQEAVVKIKSLIQESKEAKAIKQYNKLCESFTFLIDPYKHTERYLALNGNLYRVIFTKDGVSITDDKGAYVVDKLKRLQVLSSLKELK
ncbi:hypothetical protein AB6Q85_003310 [Vibrio cholerae]